MLCLRRTFLFLWMLVSVEIAFFGGCSDPSPNTTESVSSNRTSSEVSAEPVQPTTAIAEIAAPSEFANLESSEKLINSSSSVPPTTSPTSPAPAQPVGLPKLKRPEAKLSEEQKKIWSSAEYDPLVLLAVNESDRIGAVTCTAHT